MPALESKLRFQPDSVCQKAREDTVGRVLKCQEVKNGTLGERKTSGRKPRITRMTRMVFV